MHCIAIVFYAMLFDSRLLYSVVGTFYTKGHAFLFIQEQPKTFPGDGAAQATASAHWFNQIPACFKNYFSKKGKTISWYIFLGPPKVVFLLWSTRKVFCLWSLKRKNKRFENTFSSFFSFEGPRALFLFSSGFNFTNITCQLTRTKHLLSWY